MIRIILAIFMVTALGGCSMLTPRHQKPEMSLINMKTLASGNLEQRYALTFRILNPNEITMPIRGLGYTVSFQGKKFATGVSPQDLDIEAFSASELTVEVSTNLFRAARVFLELMRSQPDSIDYQLLAKIKTRIPLLGTVEVTRAGSIDISGVRHRG